MLITWWAVVLVLFRYDGAFLYIDNVHKSHFVANQYVAKNLQITFLQNHAFSRPFRDMFRQSHYL